MNVALRSPVVFSSTLAVCMLLFPLFCHAQLTLRGIVVDSTSMQALPYVNVVIQRTGPGTSSDLRGLFELKASESDTIIFSRVGYLTRKLPARSVNGMFIIFLKEERRMLDVIEIGEGRPVWMPKLPPLSPWQNSTNAGKTTDIAGTAGVQTFGPGYAFKRESPWLSNEEKKLAKVREENYRARNYVSLVNDDEVKGRIMKEYVITEETFYEMLAKFNEKNKDIIYRLEGHEVIALLLTFLAENIQKNKTDPDR